MVVNHRVGFVVTCCALLACIGMWGEANEFSVGTGIIVGLFFPGIWLVIYKIITGVLPPLNDDV